ncbi:MAG: bifunctional oligoribonuclease/PAP phosphatase NrnA [Bacteroidota bacterium]|jgi:phosphoesterase RecJ-like protein|nr:bifunctional oligoribonuclease/PAP phosphatase NrnA [Bacteroidota bacterium]
MNPRAITRIGTGDCARLLRGGHRVLLTTHTNPDGDAIGSSTALYHALRGEGIEARIILTDSPPENLAFLNDGSSIETYDPAGHDAWIASADLLVGLDFNDSARVRRMEPIFRDAAGRKVIIDHHQSPKRFADVYCSIPEASSTAEIVYDILNGDDIALPSAVALGLYVGIMTDTGSFRFDRTTPRVHRIAARLIEAGVDPTAVYRLIHDDYPLRRTRLLGMILAGIEHFCDGRVSLLTVTKDMFDATATTIEDVENIVNYGLAIRGVEATALLTATDGQVKISFRSRGRITVNDIAGRFGGGGHRLAAGATVEGRDWDELKTAVAAALCAALDDG